ncbi:hypothetical protein [Archangium sp.]|uniref:hypothetical protein n=1 Tax=Archangium sp. TaxID=1872627 RepID=UPI002D3A37EE|nr:hypothetical protein [Archangium sp.]HYO59532.1 hypothetical protein [Archangium sp.]
MALARLSSLQSSPSRVLAARPGAGLLLLLLLEHHMPLTSLSVRLSFAVALLGGGSARAEEPVEPIASAESARDVPPRNYANLRVGMSTSSRRPTLCLELSPLELLSVEACGNGSGFLHHDPEPEIAHFRAHFKLSSWKTPIGWLQPRLSAGFAELQVGSDGGGFHFEDTGPTGIETAGPEVGASLRALFPVIAGFELIGELGIGAAYFPHAPRLLQPQAAFQPNASFTLGVGF